MIKLSATFAPGPRTLEYALHAEALGYERAWVYDSPGLYWDCWPTLAQLAVGTSSIGLGVATLVPGMRHVITTAGAALAVDHLAPGRLTLSVGTGFSATRLLGKRPHTWKAVEQYTETLRTLLAGEEAQIEGVPVRCLHRRGTTRLGAATIPILLAANGPKGIAVAHSSGDGIMSIVGPIGGFSWSAYAIQGTVLDESEAPSDQAVVDRLAPTIAVQYHVAYELGGPEVVDALPGGPEWRAVIEQVPVSHRHLAVHEGHVTEPPEWERPLLHQDVVGLTFTGSPQRLAQRAAEFEAAGATELVYTPLGPDIHRELGAMAAALAGAGDRLAEPVR